MNLKNVAIKVSVPLRGFMGLLPGIVLSNTVDGLTVVSVPLRGFMGLLLFDKDGTLVASLGCFSPLTGIHGIVTAIGIGRLAGEQYARWK